MTSTPSLASEIASLFQLPPTQVGITGTRMQDYTCVTDLGNESIEFKITASKQLVDLRSILLNLTSRIYKQDGKTPLEADEKV